MVYVFPIERTSQKAIIGSAVIFSLLPVIAVVLRIVARSRLKHFSLDLSDWLIILACIVAVAYQALAVACAVVGGMGYHTSEVLAMGGQESFTLLMKLVTVVVVFWSLSLGLTKMSILALYTKIFSIRSFILISQACAVFVIIWAMVLFIGAFVICTPVEFNWDKFSTVGTCGNIRMLWAVTGGLNIFSDLVIMLLPMPYLYGLTLQMYKKIGLMVTFGIGLAVCIVSAVRLAEIVKIDMNDFPFSGGIALAFSALEPCLLVTAACIPLLRPLVSRNKSTAEASSYARGNTISNTGAHSASQMGGFSELPDDDSSTRQLHMGRSKFGGGATAAADGSSFDSSYRADNHYTEVELKAITVTRDWKVEESAA
ncbi:satratoxin biosynthesis SC1 cluster protein 4 [Trichoderma asperellum]|uniref:Satratoxin biosynthesis SC1 cluster protein 4 n=1 Tax=Trichoderma asperellum TaxID=101201 RepID=A0A6V8R7Z4_TRIAP|nr:hypothetical protein LI328DRAFT_167199 [Trichoderma asperelloides]GFP60236.1 satratoxin biosynthesis SC1 cluster protein 4 [Trichoderma asperellum]